ncbi:MAG TPA: methylamine utilization protein [Steroidobacteraceae bacterium]|nr:methylamine utilization protein [Steroidobacteraceae bacterium]
MYKILATLIGLSLALDQSGHAAELKILVRDAHGKLVADAVVVATPGDPKNAQHVKPPGDAIDQVDKQFVPYVKPVFVGSTVRFPNSDHIRHQVYSFSPAKKFELPLYGGSNAPPVVFDKPGVVVLGCNIHDWMVGYIYVSETPFFAKTAAAGTATIGELPPGEYTVRVWHPSMEQSEETTARRVTLNADAPSNVEWDLNLKPQLRVPRISGAASPGYP